MKRHGTLLVAICAALLIASPAAALQILANPASITLDSIVPDFLLGGDITLDYLGGDTVDNRTDWKLTVNGSALDVVALAFDTPIIDSGVTSDPNGLLDLSLDLSFVGLPVVGSVVGAFPFTSPMAEFFVQLEDTPSSAWLIHLDPDKTDKTLVSKTHIKFSVIPEPSAALVFAVGFAVAGVSHRRRRV